MNFDPDWVLQRVERAHARRRAPAGRKALANPSAEGGTVAPRHLGSTAQMSGVPSQSWAASHEQWNGGANDGFARSVERLRRRVEPGLAMGYWTGPSTTGWPGRSRSHGITWANYHPIPHLRPVMARSTGVHGLRAARRVRRGVEAWARRWRRAGDEAKSVLQFTAGGEAKSVLQFTADAYPLGYSTTSATSDRCRTSWPTPRPARCRR